jgi:predicted PurR-regulated permease PerM
LLSISVMPPHPVPVPIHQDDAHTTIETVGLRKTSLRWIAAVVFVAVLWWAQDVIIPVVVSILVSYALEPAVARLERWHIRRIFGVPILLIALTAGMAGGAYALRGQATAFADRLPGVAHELAKGLRKRVPGRASTMARMQQAANELERATTTAPHPPDGVTAVRVEEPTFRFNDWVWQGSHSAIQLGAQLFAIFCLVYYLLAAGDLYRRKIVRIAGTTLSEKKVTVEILGEIERQIERFIWARILISVIVGIAVWLMFMAMGLEQPGVWGVLSALFFSVPFVGPTVIVLCAGIAGFLQYDSFDMAAAAVGVSLVIAAIEGNVLTPMLMSRVGEMNAVAVFVSLMFWGWLWGIWGLLLAVPITAAIKAVCDRVDDLDGFAELLRE